jgi:hypothetical protein
MKKKTLLPLIIFIFTLVQISYAAFPVKHQGLPPSNSQNRAEDLTVHATGYKLHKLSWFSTHITNTLLPYADQLNPIRRHNDALGILSLICGIAGFVAIIYGGYILSIAAIILGAMGVRRQERFSLAGLLLGIVGVVVTIAALLLSVAILAL